MIGMVIYGIVISICTILIIVLIRSRYIFYESNNDRINGGFYRCQNCGTYITWESCYPMPVRDIDMRLEGYINRFCTQKCKDVFIQKEDSIKNE